MNRPAFRQALRDIRLGSFPFGQGNSELAGRCKPHCRGAISCAGSARDSDLRRPPCTLRHVVPGGRWDRSQRCNAAPTICRQILIYRGEGLGIRNSGCRVVQKPSPATEGSDSGEGGRAGSLLPSARSDEVGLPAVTTIYVVSFGRTTSSVFDETTQAFFVKSTPPTGLPAPSR